MDELKAYVRERCPEWTDHNVSDPGVTLLETFAYLIDTLSYRMDRVPDASLRALLGLYGIRSVAAAPEEGEVVFSASTGSQALHVPRGVRVKTEGGTPKTFSVNRSVVLPGLLDAGGEVSLEKKIEHTGFVIKRQVGGLFDWSDPFLLFVAPSTCTSLRLRFRHPNGAEVAPTGVVRAAVYKGHTFDEGQDWATMTTGSDGITLTMPNPRPEPAPVCVALTGDGSVISTPVNAHVIRCQWVSKPTQQSVRAALASEATRVVVTSVATEPPPELVTAGILDNGKPCFTVLRREGKAPLPIESDDQVLCATGPLAGTRVVVRARWRPDGGAFTPPSSSGVWKRWTGGQSWGEVSAQRVTVPTGGLEAGDIVLRWSEGREQEYVIRPLSEPVVASYGHVFRWTERGMDEKRYARFELLPAPAEELLAGPEDCEPLTAGGDGTPAKGIRVPPADFGKARVLQVVNPEPTRAGTATPTTAEALIAGVGPVERAVTAADYPRIVRDRVPAIGRVTALPWAPSADVRVLVARHEDGGVRPAPPDLTVPPELRQKVVDALEPRRLLGTRVWISGFEGKQFSLTGSVRTLSASAPADPGKEAEYALWAHFHPMVGGSDGTGWPAGRTVHLGEVHQVLGALPWVHQVFQVKLLLPNARSGRQLEEITLEKHQLPQLQSVTVTVT
ncbi:hypothetical protein [Streptomyces chrestomyceticus]|uniref:hypothetical protein n=1 Tax=Streptomyces chrestomyceticus TaxID=68185 RepID=UPI0019D2FEAC|nr:hypothetical protein [Streptomyces chrestomyceticus]